MLCVCMLIPSVDIRTAMHSDKLKNITNKSKWNSKTNVVTHREGGKKEQRNKTH